MKTIFEPNEARRFARMLDERAQDIRRLDANTAHALQELHAAHWKDVRYEQFEKKYQETSELLKRFSARAAHYAEYLRQKAVHIERYLGRS